MPKAIWNDQVIAESDDTIVVEGNHYFPPDSVRQEFLRPSSASSACYWKGRASYHTLEVDGKTNEAAAWFYPDPSDAAASFKDHVAFWKGVRIEGNRPSLLRSMFGGNKTDA